MAVAVDGNGARLEPTLVLHAICIGQCSHRVSGGLICAANLSYQFELFAKPSQKRLTCERETGPETGRNRMDFALFNLQLTAVVCCGCNANKIIIQMACFTQFQHTFFQVQTQTSPNEESCQGYGGVRWGAETYHERHWNHFLAGKDIKIATCKCCNDRAK